MICPRCQTEQEGLEECQSCGVVFAKFRPRPAHTEASEEALEDPSGLARLKALPSQIKTACFEIEEGASPSAILGRGVLLGILAVWALRLMLLPIEGEDLGESFMHLINLPFHEAGHFVFSPFGRFIHVLGGTLGQLLVPLIVAGSFLTKGNPFGASVGLWWLGQSFMDCAPYIGDARAGQLMLLGGVTGSEMPDYHDWEVLLSRLGLMSWDHTFAKIAWGTGVILILAALTWGGWILFRQWRTREGLA